MKIFTSIVGGSVLGFTLAVFLLPQRESKTNNSISNGKLNVHPGKSHYKDFRQAILDKYITYSTLNSAALNDSEIPYACVRVGNWLYFFRNDELLVDVRFYDSLDTPPHSSASDH
jgi:hypothetical protein